ncbi:SET domain-containing protein [Coniochaeta ligniaria NRRL 30616]|uniref:Ribosomal lysine N-methyltransferase 4 n=1 Tax=Coniochaeta ligniaria NRRL 30616 TaxID=1408157 RepID=A0A1J7J047_9PEZI|nr:SET domain-containing protein [Coniochaeta ligniaria NRRL 30616]
MADADFEQRSGAFLGWFKSLPGATFHQNVKIADLRPRNAGRGIITTADIEPDTVLFTIPRDSIICPANSALPAQLPDVFAPPEEQGASTEGDADDESPSSQDSWTRLILVMMYECFQSPKSRWQPYLDILPTTFNTPMFWTSDELAELQASSVVSRIGAAEAENMIAAKIIPVVRANESIFFPSGGAPSDEELMNLAGRIGSTIMAYAFDLEKDEDEEENEEDEWVEDREGKTELGMVPMADVLNADADFNAHINHETDALTAVSLRKIRAGEEILNYYGPLPNGELLRRYGYVTDAHRRWDVVELSWSLVEAALMEVLGASEAVWGKVVAQVDDEEVEDGFVVEWGSEEPDAEGHVDDKLEFHGLPEELAEQVKAFLKVARKFEGSMAYKLSDSETRKEVYLRSVLRALELRMAEYPTTLEADLQQQQAENPPGRKGMALAVRIGEKTLLREAIRWTGAEVAKLNRDVEMSDEPAAKRQRKR